MSAKSKHMNIRIAESDYNKIKQFADFRSLTDNTQSRKPTQGKFEGVEGTLSSRRI